MNNVLMIAIAISFSLSGTLAFAEGKSVAKTEKDRVSYSIGYQVGGDFKQQGTEIYPEAFLKGIEDALSASEPQLKPEEMKAILGKMKKKILAQQKIQKQKLIEHYRKKERDFLTENSKKEGVVLLPSGLQYKVLKEGEGRTPDLNDIVTVHYRGALIDGREFFNSRQGEKTPKAFRVGDVIKGMSEALQLMKENAQWQLFIPYDLAYGERGPIAEKTVIFDVELISIEKGNQTDSQK